MKLLTDTDIIQLCTGDKPMISPFEPKKVKQVERGGLLTPVLSYGTGHFGYDIRLSGKYGASHNHKTLDPKNTNPDEWYSFECADAFILQPGRFVLAQSLEYFQMPPDVIGLATGKSTYARVGIIMNVMPLEPGWNGFYTISISNIGHNPVKLHTGEGVVQIIFLQGDKAPQQQYDDGKYQNASGIQYARSE